MSLEKFKKGSSDQLTHLKNKLFTVDTHIRRSQNLPATLFMHPELIQFLTRQPQIVEITNQITLNKPKSYLLYDTPAVKFFFHSLPISEDRRFVLKIQPNKTELEVLVSLDGARKVGYLVKASKGILINETGWKKVQFTVIAKKRERLSTVKIQLDTFMIEHKTKVFGLASQRKQIQKQLKDYLKNNLTKEKIAEIMQKRRRKSLDSGGLRRAQTFSATSNLKSRQSMQSSRMFRSISNFNESTSIIKNRSPIIRQPKIQQTQIKRQLQQFEESKQKYLKHINKMEPEMAEELMQGKNKYMHQKQQTLQSISAIVSSIVFMQRFLKICRRISKQKCAKTQAIVLCKKFYRNLAHANKMRITFRTRNRMTMDMNLGMISCCLWKESQKKAQERLISKFKTELFKWDVKKIALKCEKYHQSAMKIQKKIRNDLISYRLRFQTLARNIKKINFANQQQFQQVFQEYKNYCVKKSKTLRFGFTKFHMQIDEIMKQRALKQIRL